MDLNVPQLMVLCSRIKNTETCDVVVSRAAWVPKPEPGRGGQSIVTQPKRKAV